MIEKATNAALTKVCYNSSLIQYHYNIIFIKYFQPRSPIKAERGLSTNITKLRRLGGGLGGQRYSRRHNSTPVVLSSISLQENNLQHQTVTTIIKLRGRSAQR